MSHINSKSEVEKRQSFHYVVMKIIELVIFEILCQSRIETDVKILPIKD